MKQKIARNLIRGWKTTVIGLIILVAAVTSVFLSENINWLDASIGIGIGLALLFSPDTLLIKITSLFSKNNCTDDLSNRHPL